MSNRAIRRAVARQQPKTAPRGVDPVLASMGEHLGNCQQVVKALVEAAKAVEEVGTDAEIDAHKARYESARREEIDAWNAFIGRLEQIRDGADES